jgi:glycerol-3-phosphate acyltransferase PlsX
MAVPIIALDGMGGDHAPGEIVKGAVQAARALEVEIALVGQPETLSAELSKHGTQPPNLRIVAAAEVIGMEEHPAQAARHKRDSSMVVGMRMVRYGEAQAFVSAGNTGAVMAAAIMYLGRIRGIERPSLVAILPIGGRPVLLLDVGANADCKPSYLLQFGQMASVYLERVLKINRPRVGLLSIGEEEVKGNELVRDSYELLKDSDLNFIGNVEGRDIMRGIADVIVTDGFTGNVVVKTIEGTADFVRSQIESAIRSRVYYMLPALALKGAFGSLRKKLDWREYGAGPLLGVNGLVFIGHGRSDALAILSAVRVAREAAVSGMLDALKDQTGTGASVSDS